MKRIYRDVEVTDDENGFAIALDGRPVRTPGKRHLVAPVRRLADSIADEWRAQADEIVPASMRLTRLANTALDQVGPRREEVIGEVARYGAIDLVCYRADDPPELARRQVSAWQPLIDWATDRHGAVLTVTTGLLPAAQPEGALTALRAAVASFDDFPLTGLHAATAACGSLVIGLALADGRVDADSAWDASQLDESYQIEKWGDDAEARDRRTALRADIAAAAAFMALCRE